MAVSAKLIHLHICLPMVDIPNLDLILLVIYLLPSSLSCMNILCLLMASKTRDVIFINIQVINS